MARITSLNEDKGNRISDLEAIFIVLHKLIDDKLEQKPNAGITLAKGQKNQRKIRYKEAKTLLNDTENFFRVNGCFSIGVCETCVSFNTAGHANPAFGTCRKNGEHKHKWNSCSNHSKTGGGYGV